MVDFQPSNQQSISDDQELAKVLAGVSAQADNTPLAVDEPIETTPVDTTPAPASDDVTPVVDTPAVPTSKPSFTPSTPVMSQGSNDLESIKKDAIVALRPLVDKLELAPEEKFDTYLLLLRSTDDKELIGPANEAAKAITDESRRAQALLDIIKEIDYLSSQAAA